MKRRDLEKHLRQHACSLLRHGADHDYWRNAKTGAIDMIPRHRELNNYTADGICKGLGVPRCPKR
jgi:hypothetical protein